MERLSFAAQKNIFLEHQLRMRRSSIGPNGGLWTIISRTKRTRMPLPIDYNADGLVCMWQQRSLLYWQLFCAPRLHCRIHSVDWYNLFCSVLFGSLPIPSPALLPLSPSLSSHHRSTHHTMTVFPYGQLAISSAAADDRQQSAWNKGEGHSFDSHRTTSSA